MAISRARAWLVVCLVVGAAGCRGDDGGGRPPHGSAGATGGGGSGGVAGPVGGAGGGGALPPGATQPPICEADGWCWMNPLPQGRHLRAVWASSPGDVWAGVMAPGRFLHRGNDGIWTSVSSGAEIFATAIWGSGPSSVWAVGAFGPGVILHWDGVRWSEVYRAADSLEDIRGTGPDDVWAVGPGEVLHFDGSTWRRDETATALMESGAAEFPQRVGVSARDDVWIVNGGQILRWDGAVWRSEFAHAILRDIWPIAPDNAFRALGASFTPLIEHWDGSAWRPSLTSDPNAAPIQEISGSAANDVWAVDEDGATYHFDGSGWTAFHTGEQLLTTGLWAEQPGVALTVGFYGEISELSAGSWRRVTRGPFAILRAMHGAGPSRVWFGGDNFSPGRIGHSMLLHWNGVDLREVPLPAGTPPSNTHISAVWSPDEYTVWVGGDGGLLARRDGARWQLFPVVGGGIVHSIWGATPDDAWMVTDLGVFHWDGRTWTLAEVPLEFVTDVHGSAVDNVWIGGSQVSSDGQAAARWNGSQWNLLPAGGHGNLWVNAPDDGWSLHVPFMAPLFELSHFDGVAWTRVRGFEGQAPGGLWSPGRGEVYLAGDAIRHFRDGVWTEIEMQDLGPIWGSSRNDIWAGGAGGAILRRVISAP